MAIDAKQHFIPLLIPTMLQQTQSRSRNYGSNHSGENLENGADQMPQIVPRMLLSFFLLLVAAALELLLALAVSEEPNGGGIRPDLSRAVET